MIHNREGSDWVPRGHATLLENVSLARAVVSYLNIPPLGMKNFYWPCRMEVFKLSASNPTIVLDGCHNQQSVHLFLQSLRELYPKHKILVLFGAGAEKSVDDMVVEVGAGADK